MILLNDSWMLTFLEGDCCMASVLALSSFNLSPIVVDPSSLFFLVFLLAGLGLS
jgi:hypothetical protein